MEPIIDSCLSDPVSQSVSTELTFSSLSIRMCARSPGFEQRPDGGEDDDGKHGEDDAFGSRTH